MRVVRRRLGAVGARDEEVGEVAADQVGTLGVAVDQQVDAADLAPASPTAPAPRASSRCRARPRRAAGRRCRWRCRAWRTRRRTSRRCWRCRRTTARTRPRPSAPSPESTAIPSNVPTSLAIAAAEEPRAAQALGARPAAVGEAHEREPVADRQVHDPVDLRVVDAGLGAAPHRVVVGRDGDRLAVQRPEPGDETARRLVVGAGEHAGLDERAGSMTASMRSRAVSRPRSWTLATASGRASS